MKLLSFSIVILIATIVIGNHCHRKVDAFVKRIFKGVKLSLDQDDLVALTDMKRGPCSSTRRIYFSAYLTRHVSSSELKNNQSIVFTDVQTNEGGGYNSKTGEFTAPITGTYTFFWEFLVYPGGTIGLELQKNYKEFQHNYAHGSDSKYEVGSKSTIMNLVKGDKVRVVYVGGAGKIYGNHRYTGFSGIFL